MYGVVFYTIWYAIGWLLSFYVIARWDQRQMGPDTSGLALACISLFWPIIFAGVALWHALSALAFTIEKIGKPFTRFKDWSITHPSMTRQSDKPEGV